MKILLGRCMVAFCILGATTFVFAGEFKSKVVTSSPLVITVPDNHFLKVTNFTQEGGVDRGVLTVTLTDETGGTANVLAATRIDLSTGTDSQNPPESINRVIIAGPAQVTVVPVVGATLFLSYRKEPNEGTPSSTTVVVVSPTPPPAATPTATPTPTPYRLEEPSIP